ncbi:hypothetical protein CMI37_17315 [Candidatus Pacearchaeota archaeon]|nr:hypothetical protein [Candidatus Pacearchaeota archaeon]
MKNSAIYSYDQSVYINGTGLSGIQSINGSYGISEKPVNILGYGHVNSLLNQPLQGSFQIQRSLVSQDPFLQLTGNKSFSGSIHYEGANKSSSFGFHSGYLSSFAVSCKVGAVPSVSVGIVTYGDLGSGIIATGNTDSATPATQTIQVPDQGGISVTCEGSSSNRITSLTHSINIPRQPIYALPTTYPDAQAKFPVQVDISYPIETRTNFTLEIDDYETHSMYDYLTGVLTGDVDISIKDEASSTIMGFNLKNARLLSESFSSNANGTTNVTLGFGKYYNIQDTRPTLTD